MLPDLAFHSPHYLWGLLLIPLLFVWSWWEKRRRAVLRFSAAHVFTRHPRGVRVYLLPMLPLLRAAAVAAALVALARPQSRDTRVRDLNVEGIDIVVALDLSTSMEAGDFRPQNRLHVAKEVLSEFITNRVNDRIGLVVFAGAAYTQAPLTLDYGVLKEVLRQLRTRVLEDGTAIGDALATALNRLRDSDAKSRVVVLITDGDNNAGKISPLDSAGMAKSLRIPIYTILVGKGGKVPFPQGTDLFGNTVWRETEIPINPELLQDIADSTGGEYYRATDPEGLKQGLQKVLDSLERSKLMEGGASANYREDYHSYLLLAFGFAVLELFLRSTFLRVSP
ncbi:BatA aerotolerance operon protein [Cystobacter fuscus DSM 2262]|uniref:BatA aerotolerance operon protein n=1 Tax=Cystobacter fuscus (strain ATCC 25194 / DSM 2262 / NBRC 100088 / M29) TaxID=1242864 RepID=S9PF94_CYSF2|nr:VWA domain-containing protein [Cystobacter fuscus]EPX63050.1 BatA aerotolerance operon protein [Cystobacter fuscus DSM 2262]